MATPLIPDEVVFASLFGDTQPTVTKILSNRADACVFRAIFDTPPALLNCDNISTDLLVHLEIENSQPPSNKIESVATLQKLAALQIPEFVPRILESGITNFADGRFVNFTIEEYTPDTVRLSTVWRSLADDEKDELVSAVVAAMKRLQQPLPVAADALLRGSMWDAGNGQRYIGGPRVQYLENVRQLFFGETMIWDDSHEALAQLSTEDVTVHSDIDGVEDVTVTQAQFDILKETVTLSHNNIEPRNILVCRSPQSDSEAPPQYELAAVVSWEEGGFLPLAHELATKDTDLGSSNLDYDWYRLYRDKAQEHLV